MPRRWTIHEEEIHRKELALLYVSKNKTISEIGSILGISEKTVHKRLKRLGIKSTPEKKKRFRNKRSDIYLPNTQTVELAELIGVLLGDGHISHFQVMVTLGNKEESYAEYVKKLMYKIFLGAPKISVRKKGYSTVYLGSTEAVSFLKKQGMRENKIRDKADAPEWVFNNDSYISHFLRGFFDTDGSVYKIRFGIQLSFTNLSSHILKSLHRALLRLEYNPSRISCNKIYLTKQRDVRRFFEEIRPQNKRHLVRFDTFLKSVGTQAVNEDRL